MFTEFYVQATGDNRNAGSTTADAASVTVTNGDWGNAAANRYTAPSGTPFSAVQIGEWASIYLDAATSAVYIAQVTAINAGGASIDLSATIKIGTAPANGATGRSCKIGGAHASEIPWATFTGSIPLSVRVNVKAATYTVVTNRTFSLNGTTAFQLWFRGYNTTIGDCDLDRSLTPPLLALNATFQFTMNGTHQKWSSFDITGNRSGTIAVWQGSSVFQVRSENTSSNSSAIAISSSSLQCVFVACWAKVPATATGNGAFTNTTTCTYIDCVAIGGGRAGFFHNVSASLFMVGCVARDGVIGLETVSTGTSIVFGCTFKNMSSDGIRLNATPARSAFMSNLCSDIGGVGIKNNTGTNTNFIQRYCNAFYNCTGGNESGFGDSPSLFEITEPSQPITSSTDMTPVATALAIAAGMPPGLMPNEAYRSYLDIGAVQRQAASGAGGCPIIGGSIVRAT